MFLHGGRHPRMPHPMPAQWDGRCRQIVSGVPHPRTPPSHAGAMGWAPSADRFWCTASADAASHAGAVGWALSADRFWCTASTDAASHAGAVGWALSADRFWCTASTDAASHAGAVGWALSADRFWCTASADAAIPCRCSGSPDGSGSGVTGPSCIGSNGQPNRELRMAGRRRGDGLSAQAVDSGPDAR